MGDIPRLYRQPLPLMTDLYELTMACGYWKLGISGHEAAFTIIYRSNPFHGGYAIACGLHDIIAFLQDLRFDEADVDYLATLNGNDGRPLFAGGFLAHLRDVRFDCDLDAVPEGTVVFP